MGYPGDGHTRSVYDWRMTNPGRITSAKQELRRRIIDARAALPDDVRRGFDEARTSLVSGLLAGVPAAGRAPTSAVYLSRPPEPDTFGLVARLCELGWRVIVPSPGDGPRPWARPAWVRYAEPVVDGPRGIPVVPDGVPADLAEADVIVLPGLAASPDGTRLGYGSAWYDRALLAARAGVPRWVLLNDAEVVDAVPRADHDQTVDLIVTPSRLIETVNRLTCVR